MHEKMNRLATQMQDILARAKSEGRKHLTSVEREKYHRLEEEYTSLEEQAQIESGTPRVAAVERLAAGARVSDIDLEELRDVFRESGSRKRVIDKTPHGQAFSNLLRNGERLGGEDRAILDGANAGLGIHNAQSTTVGTQGGDLVPQGFSEQLEEAKKWFGGIEGTCERFPTGTGNTVPWPTINDTTNAGRIIGQNTQMVETDLVFGTVTFNSYIGSSDLILIPLSLVQDSYFDLDALAARLLGMRLGRLFNKKCTVGTGTNEPTGIVTAAVNFGNIFQLGIGNTAAINYANLVDLQHSVDPAYREDPSTKWMFSDTMLKLIKKLTDGNGRPLWQPGILASFRDGADVIGGNKPRILESEYVINQDMAIPAASAYTILYGMMSAYKVREVAGGTTVLVLRERYADYLQVGMTAFQRFDGNLIDAGTHPIAVLQQSAT
jgi:HK97 family phage major capsid protein